MYVTPHGSRMAGVQPATIVLISRNKFIWLVEHYEVENSSITTTTLIPYFDVSISTRDLHQKLLLSLIACTCLKNVPHYFRLQTVPADLQVPPRFGI